MSYGVNMDRGFQPYRVNRDRGFQPWGVTNPWVFANYGQPQRGRGYVSPLAYTTQPPYLRSEHLAPRWPYFPSSHLGQTETVTPAEARARRMEIFSMIGLGLSATSLFLFWRHVVNGSKPVRSNRRRRSRSRRSR
jgi:hypothetical protein